MTLDEFLVCLEEVPVRWHLCGEDIRSEYAYCPINQVVRIKRNPASKLANCDAMRNAQKYLHMDVESSRLVVWAADGVNMDNPEFKAVRQKLLRTCRLPTQGE